MFQCAVNALVAILIAQSWPLKMSAQRMSRLAGGQEAELGEFPFIVASLHTEVRCTAAIVSAEWVLGAAHCYVVEGHMVRISDVIIVAGIVDYMAAEVPPRQDRLARQIVIHPYFQERKLSTNDLGLVRVDSFNFHGPYVRPIPLAGEGFPVERSVQCTAAGWGDTQPRDSDNTLLRKLDVIAVQNEDACHGLKSHQRKKVLCLMNNHGRGLCDGDSGGPLICNGELYGVAHQVYIERDRMAPFPDMDCGAADIVHTYMFTCPYLDWIRMFVPEAPPRPPQCYRHNRHVHYYQSYPTAFQRRRCLGNIIK